MRLGKSELVAFPLNLIYTKAFFIYKSGQEFVSQNHHKPNKSVETTDTNGLYNLIRLAML